VANGARLLARRRASRSFEQKWPFVFIAVATSLKFDVLSMIPAQIVSQADELRLYVVSRSRSLSLEGGGI